MKKTCIVSFLLLMVSISYAQDIVINEILAGNTNDIEDVFFEHDDWLELYYPSGSMPAVFNLAGYFLSDDPDNLGKWTIPSTNAALTTIVAGQHLIFWIDKDPEQGEDHVDFKLSLEGESVYLTAPDTITIIDSVTFPQMVDDISYGRACDGCEEWVFFNNTTPDDPNMELDMPTEILFINEVMTSNSTNIADENDENEMWIEIYNPNPYQVDLSGYTFTTSESDAPIWLVEDSFPVKTAIPAESFRTFWFDAENEEGENHSTFSLDVAGSDLILLGPDGTEVDQYTYPEIATDVSWGRQSDGSATSIFFNIPTPRVTNSLIIVESPTLYINEVLCSNNADTIDNYLQTEDWVEIYNPNSFAVDLAGYYMSDNPDNPMKWQFAVDNPDSTVIEPMGWMLLWADEDGVQGVNHMSFRLNNTAEQVRLFTPDGFTMVDEISWENETPDVSYGRNGDGNAEWVHFVETTPDASNGTIIGIEESELAEGFTAYPNPLTHNQTLQFNKTCDFRVLNASGQQIREWNRANQFDVNNLDSGIYFVQTRLYGVIKIIVN